MARKYKGRPTGKMTSPRARSNYRGTKLISNPNSMQATYNSAGGLGSEYGSHMKAVEVAGPARKIALKKILHRGM